MAKAEELWAESAWEEGTEWPLALMLRDGESGLGVEDDDEPKRNPEKRIFFSWPQISWTKPSRETYRREQQRSLRRSVHSRNKKTQLTVVALYISYR